MGPLQAKVAALSAEAERLPALRAQLTRVQASAAEVGPGGWGELGLRPKAANLVGLAGGCLGLTRG